MTLVDEERVIRRVAAISRVLDDELCAALRRGAQDVSHASGESVSTSEFTTVLRSNVGETFDVGSISYRRGPAVVGGVRVDETRDRECATRWCGDDGEELTGCGAYEKRMVEGVILDVVVTPPPIRCVVVHAGDGETEAPKEDGLPVWPLVRTR